VSPTDPGMTLTDHYQASLKELGLSADPAQARAVAVLERVRTDLLASRRPSVAGALRTLLRRPAPVAVRGAYLWGGVGRGKTLVMDLFCDTLPFDDKARYHFHRLMNRVHRRLAALRLETDPLARVADELAAEARVLCFDEFFVSDIADAMILGRLLDALFQRGVALVATSNIPPDDLYRGGLQRQRFLPAIEALKGHTEVVHVDGLTDYRLRVLESAEIWHSPLDAQAERNLERYFREMAPDRGSTGEALEVLGRTIHARQRADGMAWFDFAALCEGPRGPDDYIEIARWFQTVIVSAVPVMDARHENEARRFVAMVDEFYDRRVNLIVSAAAPIHDIYRGSRLQREFERTRSRLLEMQSVEYLAAGHLP
jgi:cell division protein ZapE